MKKIGWAVQISRDDGSVFFAASKYGTTTPIWDKRCRLGAVAHCKELKQYKFNARVVKVEYTEQEVFG